MRNPAPATVRHSVEYAHKQLESIILSTTYNTARIFLRKCKNAMLWQFIQCVTVSPCSMAGDKSVPPKLEPSVSLPLINAVSHSEPPTLKPIEPCPDKHRRRKDGVSQSLNGHSHLQIEDSDVSVVATSTLAEPSSPVNRRTSVLFRKSKSTSPHKPADDGETPKGSSRLGTKTFLSVVIPRLETLLHTRKRPRSASGDSCEDQSPIKRLDTGRICRKRVKKGKTIVIDINAS